MTRIVLTQEQLRGIAGEEGPIDVSSPDGEPLGSLSLLTPEDRAALEAYKRRKAEGPGPTVPGDRVQALLQKFHELDDKGGIDESTVKEMLRRTVAGEPLG